MASDFNISRRMKEEAGRAGVDDPLEMVDEEILPLPHGPLWFPYAQMKLAPALREVAGAEGARLHMADGRILIDAVSSWWAVIHGYNHPRLNEAAARQMRAATHVMMGGLVHESTRAFADKLVEITPDPLRRVFFSDSGSVGVEVAMKMAAQFWINRGREEKNRFLALKRAYHGDTLWAMSVCDPEDGMHARFSNLLPTQRFLEAPRGGYQACDATVEADVDTLKRTLESHHQELAGMIVEPLVQAAGGMNFYSPAHLRAFRQLCDRYGVLLIFDEVATGFGRTGRMFAADHANVCPDLMVLGKGMTAGYFGHAATLATDRVYEAFYGDDRALAFMHGPTFMGNAAACAVGLESIKCFEEDGVLERIATIERRLTEGLVPLTGSRVIDSRALGAIGVVEADSREALQGLQAFAAERGVWLRPFDRFAYTMPPYVIEDDELAMILDVLRAWFST